MPKFFIKDSQRIENDIFIINEDFNHIKNVLRLKKYDELNICNIDLNENYICEIDEISADSVKCRIVKKVEITSEPSIYINIFQGLPKADKMEFIIEKCTEIGVSEFTPVKMDRCVVKLDAKNEVKKIERWQKIAEAAAKQSGRDIIPKVNNIINYREIFEIKDYDLIILAYEKENNNKLKNILNNLVKKENIKIAFIIGPEGGISEEELKIAINNKISIVTLGKRILRTETAPMVISANTLYELE